MTDPLLYQIFYETDPVAMADWTNVSQDYDLGLLVDAAERGQLLLPDVGAVFFYRRFVVNKDGNKELGPMRLRADHEHCWRVFWSLLSPLVAQGRVLGCFIGDEMLWRGARPQDIARATALIGASFGPRRPMLYLNEATDVFTTGTNIFKAPVQAGPGGSALPVQIRGLGVTHISIDAYTRPRAVEMIYRNHLYPTMGPNQRAFAVPQAFGSTYDPHESERLALDDADGYLAWARRDFRIEGLNPWHWYSYRPFGCRGIDGDGLRINNTIGARDMPRLRAWWSQTGQEILARSPVRPRSPQRLSLRHTFEGLGDGAALPSVFALDPAANGGATLDDPSAPSTSDVAFSTARGSKTSIFMKHPGAAFRYSWGTVPRGLEGLVWVSARTGAQIFRCNVWIDDPAAASLTMSLYFGPQRIAAVHLAPTAATSHLLGKSWNRIELLVSLNDAVVRATVNGHPTLAMPMELVQTATAVLFEGGPHFVADVELRSLPSTFSGTYANTCAAMGPASNLVIDGARVLATEASGDAYAKDGDGYWMWESAAVDSVAAAGNRIGVVKKAGDVFVKEGGLDAQWVWESGDVRQLVLDGLRIGVVKKAGDVFVKEGGLDAQWVWESGDVRQLVLDGLRIGVVKKAGDVFVKEGGLYAQWVWESGDVRQLVLDGLRIGVVKKAGDVFVKEGGLDAQWVWESGDVRQLVLDGLRIGVVKKAGDVFVKEGGLDAQWVWESGDIQHLALDHGRIGVLRKDGTLFVKEGPLDAHWVWQTAIARLFRLDRDGIGIVTKERIIYFKRGPLDSPWKQLTGTLGE